MTMKQLIIDFPLQLEEALAIGKTAKGNITAPIHEIRNILVCGLGGSGMGANVVMDLLGNTLSVPMSVSKGYHIPAYVNEHTLIIGSSYSGNTEETVMSLHQALDKGAKVVVITTGGKLAAIAEEKDLDMIKVPAGQPPRASLGYSLVQQLFVLHYLGFHDDSFIADLEGAVDLLRAETEDIKVQAKEWAANLQDKLPIVYSVDGYGSVAIRWRQQINENGKMLCWHHVIPEMNHNELVGWRTKDERFAPIFLYGSDTFERNQTRIEINKTIMGKYTSNIFELKAKGNNHIERWMYLDYFGDWVSWYLSVERNMDATEVEVIDFLKGELGKVALVN